MDTDKFKIPNLRPKYILTPGTWRWNCDISRATIYYGDGGGDGWFLEYLGDDNGPVYFNLPECDLEEMWDENGNVECIPDEIVMQLFHELVDKDDSKYRMASGWAIVTGDEEASEKYGTQCGLPYEECYLFPTQEEAQVFLNSIGSLSQSLLLSLAGN